MSNKHVNHQHGLTTMNETRPKSKLRKRTNKAKAKTRKAPLLAALQEARYGKPVEKSHKKTISKKLAAKIAGKKKEETPKAKPVKKTVAKKKSA